MTHSHERRLKRANEVLSTSDYGSISARPDGIHARYQFFWSEDLWTAIPLTDADGNPRYELICPCGIDKVIHSPDCHGLTVASVKFTRVKVDPTIANVFVLCTWLPPPTEESWANMYGSFQYYPREGRYVPLDINGHKLTLPYPPFEDTARVLVRMVKDHETNKHQRMLDAETAIELREAKRTRDYTPPPNAKYWQNYHRLHDVMTLDGHRPGSKGSVSYPTYVAPTAPKPLIEIAN